MNPIEVFERCMSDKPYSNELKIYTEKYLLEVVKELALIEEYEKCIELNKFIKKRFS